MQKERKTSIYMTNFKGNLHKMPTFCYTKIKGERT